MAERWVKTKGWLKNYVPKKPKDNKIFNVSKNIRSDDDFAKGVAFILPKCPCCGSKKLRCYGSQGNIRYYKCKCGAKFKAFEKEN